MKRDGGREEAGIEAVKMAKGIIDQTRSK